MNPAVITSKSASRDLEKIRAQHAAIVDGISNQAVRVAAARQQKAAEMAAQNTMKMEMDKEKMASNNNAQKNALDFQAKQGDLDIKRASLAAK